MEANYVPNTYGEYKTRNILSLADRVEVIREYDRHLTRPSLQSLAQKFECSSKQIKNILLNRDTILQSYKNSNDTDSTHKQFNNHEDLHLKRQEKIAFLGKVMYEYIQRVLYFNHNIDDHKFRQKALQIKECIAIENFQPTYAWLEDFKATYGIPAFDLTSLRNNIVIREAKQPYLSAIAIIQHVTRMEQESRVEENHNTSNVNKSYVNPDVNENGLFNLLNNLSSIEPKVIYEIEDEEDDELKKLKMNDSPPTSTAHTKFYSPQKKPRTSSPFPDIKSVDEALKHLRTLEEYAMLQDNFRAIGLLTQLEQIFQKQDKARQD